MQFRKPIPKTKLEKIFLEQIEKDTPKKIKTNKIIDLNNNNEFTFLLKKEHLQKYTDDNESFGILEWYENYKNEAKVSTAGIRGLQNPLYPWDTRYPMNLLTIALATLGKVMVAKDNKKNISKICTCETRYNSDQFVELIARIQAAQGVKTYVSDNYRTMPIFLISFLIFTHDLYGGEYVTSSHALAKKIATKDLNNQGSQFIPSESLQFVAKVKKVLDEVEKKGQYEIKFSKSESKYIDRKFLKDINYGIKLYSNYLKKSVATNHNIKAIQKLKRKILIDCVGGSMAKTFKPILNNLKIEDKFEFLHKKEDPFHHQVGKLIEINDEFFDWGCDTTIMEADLKTLNIKIPVIETMNYENILKKYPIGTVILITDPDADRLITSYIEDECKIDFVKKYGLVFHKLDKGRILVMFTPNQSFLMTFDYQKSALEKAKLWDKYNWFMLKTTASQLSWDQWAQANNVQVVNTPVGFKELSDVMKNVESKIEKNNNKEIKIKDVFGNTINLGKKPRLLFAGEESGGEIFGPHELIKSKKGRIALAMREKSAGEAIIITSALTNWLMENNKSLTDYFVDVLDKNKISARYEIRIDNKYYNESEPDIDKLLKDKAVGIGKRTKNDMYFLSMAIGFRDGIITMRQVKDILSMTFTDLDFSDLIDIKFVGDGTFLLFKNKCVEVRPSGTDAVNKSYSYGNDQWECIKYAKYFSSFDGKRGKLHNDLIPEKYYKNIKEYSFDIYNDYKENM